MPRFVFNLSDASTFKQAINLPDLEAARHEAVKLAGGLIQDNPANFWAQGGEWQMTVANGNGLVLFALTFYATDAPALCIGRH